MDVEGRHRANLCFLDVEEASTMLVITISDLLGGRLQVLYVVRGCVDDGEQKHRVCRLSVEPLALVERYELDLWAQDPEDVPTHGQENKATVQSQRQSGSPRYPHRVS